MFEKFTIGAAKVSTSSAVEFIGLYEYAPLIKVFELYADLFSIFI
jgi:hypothetical protein